MADIGGTKMAGISWLHIHPLSTNGNTSQVGCHYVRGCQHWVHRQIWGSVKGQDDTTGDKMLVSLLYDENMYHFQAPHSGLSICERAGWYYRWKNAVRDHTRAGWYYWWENASVLISYECRMIVLVGKCWCFIIIWRKDDTKGG